MFWKRLVLGSVMIAAVAGIAAFDGWLSARAIAAAAGGIEPEGVRARLACGLPITLLVVTVVMLATYELGHLCQASSYRPATHWAAFVGGLITLVPWIEMQQRMNPEGARVGLLPVDLPLGLFLLTGAALGTGLVVLLRKTTERAVSNMGITLLMVLYLGLLGSFAIRLRCLCPGPAGAALVIFFILTVKSGDIGAYFVGKVLGKHKLAPWLSPGKTIEGAVGAVVFCCGVALGGMAVWHQAGGILGPAPVDFAQAIVFGLVMAIGGLLGDLVESAIKRDTGNKDSGQAVPAFGGLLDIVDSAIFTAPVAWWLLTFWGRMG